MPLAVAVRERKNLLVRVLALLAHEGTMHSGCLISLAWVVDCISHDKTTELPVGQLQAPSKKTQARKKSREEAGLTYGDVDFDSAEDAPSRPRKGVCVSRAVCSCCPLDGSQIFLWLLLPRLHCTSVSLLSGRVTLQLALHWQAAGARRGLASASG